MIKPSFQIFVFIIFILALLMAPLFMMIFLFGLAGSTPFYSNLMTLGYAVFLISLGMGAKKQKYLYGAALGLGLFMMGVYLDRTFWRNENNQMCHDLRADPHCVESKTGFTCSGDSSYGGFVTGNGMCPKLSDTERTLRNEQKRTQLVANKVNRSKKTLSHPSSPSSFVPKNVKLPANLSIVTHMADRYRKIAHAIINSPIPKNLDFENELSAIYECFNYQYDNPLIGEQRTSHILRKLITTREHEQNYRAYSAIHGRHISKDLVISALPAGPVIGAQSCHYWD